MAGRSCSSVSSESHDKLNHIGHLPDLRSDSFFPAVFLIRDEVASEDLEHSFGSADKWRHVESNMYNSGDEALLFYFVTSKSESEHRTNDWNRFDDSLGDSPTAGSHNSSFDCSHSKNLESRISNRESS